MRVLLVEPGYYTQYPPLGLLKLSSLYKAQGHEVRFVRGLELVTRFVPDEVKVTSLFTWAWKPVWEAVAFYRALFPRAKISLGGIYASLALSTRVIADLMKFSLVWFERQKTCCLTTGLCRSGKRSDAHRFYSVIEAA